MYYTLSVEIPSEEIVEIVLNRLETEHEVFSTKKEVQRELDNYMSKFSNSNQLNSIFVHGGSLFTLSVVDVLIKKVSEKYESNLEVV